MARTQIASFSDTPAEYNHFFTPYRQHIPLAIDEGRVTHYQFLMAMPTDAADVLTFAEHVLGPQKTRPLQPEGKEYDLYHLASVYLSGRTSIALARAKEGNGIVAMMAIQAFDPVYHVDDIHAFAADYHYMPETTAVYRRTLIDERYPRLPVLRALVKGADRFVKAQGYRWVYRHCHHNDLPVMLQWKRVGYAITEEDFATGSIHMCKTL